MMVRVKVFSLVLLIIKISIFNGLLIHRDLIFITRHQPEAALILIYTEIYILLLCYESRTRELYILGKPCDVIVQEKKPSIKSL